MDRSTIGALATITVLTIGGITAVEAQQGRAVYTAGQFGAYHTLFCSAIVSELAKAKVTGYACTPSGGTPDNIGKVLGDPRSVGLAQLDVFARWSLDHAEAARSLVVIRTLACEGLWIVTKSNDMGVVTFGQIVGGARRLQFAVADGGSRASFEFLQKIDPNGLGRAGNNVRIVDDATAVIDQVASGNAAVGFFVQFADPSNANIKLLRERKLRTVPVVNRELVAAKVGDTPVYQVKTFSLTEKGILTDGSEATTSCTPAVIITGAPGSIADRKDADDQRVVINAIKAAPDAAFLPHGWLAGLISNARTIGGPVLNEMLGAYDVARKKAETPAH